MIVRVYLRSTPGHYAQYDGHVDIAMESIEDSEEAFILAVRKLARTSFSDRASLSYWKFIRLEILK